MAQAAKTAAILAALAGLLVLAQAPAQAADYDRNSIRFPVYDPSRGSLEGYRQALLTAVDAHVAHIRSGEMRPAEVAPLVLRAAPATTGASLNPIGRIGPAAGRRGEMSGSVGTSVPSPPASRR